MGGFSGRKSFASAPLACSEMLVDGQAVRGWDVTTVSDVLRKSKGKYVILHSYIAG